MKNILLVTVLFAASMLYATDGIVLYPELSYRTDDKEMTYVDKNYFGDTVELTGEIKTINKNNKDIDYKVITIEGENYLSSSYFIVENSSQGTIVKPAFLYKMNDLSTPTSTVLNPMLFVAVDNNNIDGDLIKISYLSKVKNGWAILDGWVKSSLVSKDKDNCGAAIKYFLATQQESLEAREDRLGLILKRHKSSTFIPLVKKMLDEDHLRVSENTIVIDPDFAGSNEELKTPYDVVIYKEADILSEILFSGKTEIILNKKSMNTVTFNDATDYMYHVTSKEATGWIHGLK